MTELYLGEVDMSRFQTLGERVPGLIQATATHRTSTATAQPGDWYTPRGLIVSRYEHPDFPIMIRTTYVISDIKDDPQFGLVKAVVKELECKRIHGHKPSEFH